MAVPDDIRAVLEGVYGDDPKITPGDRLRAAEQLGLLQKEDPAGAVRRELLALDPAALQAEYDAYVSSVELPQLLAGGEAAARFPLTAQALQAEVARRAEAQPRVLADAERIEREIEERAQARAEQLYRSRAFKAVAGDKPPPERSEAASAAEALPEPPNRGAEESREAECLPSVTL